MIAIKEVALLIMKPPIATPITTGIRRGRLFIAARTPDLILAVAIIRTSFTINLAIFFVHNGL